MGKTCCIARLLQVSIFILSLSVFFLFSVSDLYIFPTFLSISLKMKLRYHVEKFKHKEIEISYTNKEIPIWYRKFKHKETHRNRWNRQNMTEYDRNLTEIKKFIYKIGNPEVKEYPTEKKRDGRWKKRKTAISKIVVKRNPEWNILKWK